MSITAGPLPPVGVLVVLEGQHHSAIMPAGGCAWWQDDVLGEADVQTPVVFYTGRPCEVGEVYSQPICAQVIDLWITLMLLAGYIPQVITTRATGCDTWTTTGRI